MGESTYSYNSLDDNTLARLSKNGDDNAFNELAMRYLNTINFIARKYSAEGYEQNDFVQEGLLALLYACRTLTKTEVRALKTICRLLLNAGSFL